MEIKVIHELRPCIVNGVQALFHRWVQMADIIPPSPMIGGHKGGVAQRCVALVETEDGHIYECYPTEIVFCDNKVSQYCFDKQAQQEVDDE